MLGVDESKTQETQSMMDVIHKATQANEEVLTQKFDDLETKFQSSKDIFSEAQIFLKAAIKDANQRFGISISLTDVCKRMKDRFNSIDVSNATKSEIFKAIDHLCQDGHGKVHHLNQLGKQERQDKEKISKKGGWPGIVPFIIGLVEAGIGAAVVPINPVAGGILIADGASRVVQGISDNIEGSGIDFPF